VAAGRPPPPPRSGGRGRVGRVEGGVGGGGGGGGFAERVRTFWRRRIFYESVREIINPLHPVLC
jgi:hypothetical protein